MKDICQGDTSLTETVSLDHWNAMIRAFLAHGTATPVHLGAVLTANPGFAMGHAIKGLFCLLLARREMVQTAREALLAARAGEAPSKREAELVAGLAAWLEGSPSKTVDGLERILAANPADTLAMKLSQAILFVKGDARGMRASVERVLGAHGADHPFRGFALGCHAFTLEESGEYEAAEAAGLQGLGYAPDDAWGLHAVAHVCDMTGAPARGIKLIEAHDGSWLQANNFRYHVWWHKALLHLDLGQTDEVLAIYDQRIRADKTDDYRDISNAASLLMRLSLEGVDLGDRWEELAVISERRIEDACLAFADLHYLLALMGGERQSAIATLLSRMATDAQAAPLNEFDQVLAHPGRVCAQGLASFAEGDFAGAFSALQTAQPVLQSIGGSHAQRDVFARLTIDAGIRAGQFDQAEALIAARADIRRGTEDRFAAHRRETIAAARHKSYGVAAQ